MSAQVRTGRELAEQQAVEHMLATRAMLRSARADFAAAVKAAHDLGVDHGRIADELMRDSAAHDLPGRLEALIAREVLQ